MRNVAFHNLGCKVNSYEMDGIQQDFQKAGYNIVEFAQKSDIYIINTCSVTNIADRKSRQMIHRAKKQNPNAIVVALGCFVQENPEKAALDEAVDIVIGNNLKSQTFSIVENYLNKAGEESVYVEDLTKNPQYEDICIEKSAEHTRAFIKIQDGCNQFCSYCIIPYVRGRIRSREKESILNEITIMANAGYKEIVITGIHLSSYGLDGVSYNEVAKDGYTNKELLDVIDEVSLIEGVERIRLGSLEPRLITDEFLRRLSANKKVCPHFHLSLQSGCDSVLKRMNRHYTTQEYAKRVALIRQYYSHPAVTTDVIVGFPQETEEEFEVTRQYLNEIDFYEVHVFKYSRRAGTVADKMTGQLTDAEKSKRSDILLGDDAKRRKKFMEFYVGEDVSILLEESETIDGKEYMVGHTPDYVKCAIAGECGMAGQIVSAKGACIIGDGVLLCDHTEML